MCIINPWIANWNTWNPNGIKVAQCDQNIINSFVINKPRILQLNAYPEPFIGNSSAPVYLLNGNPGAEPNPKNVTSAFINSLTNSVLNHTGGFFFFDKNKSTIEGYNWWKKYTNKLCQTLGHDPDLFNIEYFPYHSINLKGIPVLNTTFLPSYDYANFLIRKAIDDGKIIVIMRLDKCWRKRIPELNYYQNVFTLSNPRRVYLTQNNLSGTITQKQAAWGKLISVL